MTDFLILDDWVLIQTNRLDSVRIFHQNFVLGLIEAARGVSSVCRGIPFCNQVHVHPSEETLPQRDARDENSSVSIAVQAYDDLYAVIAVVLPDYTDSLVKALHSFFDDYEEFVRTGILYVLIN